MSLRDWFAGQAIAGLAAAEGRNLGTDAWDVETLVIASFEIADAMLDAREEPNEYAEDA